MPRAWLVPVEELREEAFAPYGETVRQPHSAAMSSGPGWDCWYGFRRLSCPWPLHFGVVRTKLRPIVVSDMERHLQTFELIAPHGEVLIQPVAQPLALDDPEAKPDIATVRAFRIPADAAIIMHPGTWHSAALPETQDATYAFACMEPDSADPPVWVPFPYGDTVRAVPPSP